MIPLIPDADLIPLPVPVIVHEGRYRLYRKPDGGMHIAYKRDDRDTEDHMEMPVKMVTLAQAISDGTISLPQFLREMMSMMSELKKQ